MIQKIEVKDDKRVRIDVYLSNELDYPRSKIQKMIENDYILVNNRKVKNSYKLEKNDIIEIKEYNENIEIKAENIPLDIVYEDDDVIVVNKKSGMVVHPGAGNYSKTLVNALMHYSKNLSKVNGDFRPGIVHRIDKDTSGLLLVAKNDFAHNFLAKELEEKKVNRVYIALVSGNINHDTGTVDAPIGRNPNDRKKMDVTDKNSKNAITHFKVLERYKNATLIECKLETGRTHQIRVHMKYINHPVINDPIYGSKKNVSGFGQLLHAKTIGFHHPRTNEYLEFSVPIPDEFNEILDKYKEE